MFLRWLPVIVYAWQEDLNHQNTCGITLNECNHPWDWYCLLLIVITIFVCLVNTRLRACDTSHFITDKECAWYSFKRIGKCIIYTNTLWYTQNIVTIYQPV